VAVSSAELTAHPPRRELLGIAAGLTQLVCGGALLVGAVGLVLVLDPRSQAIDPVGAALGALWLVAALVGLIFGGLVYRGDLVSMLVAAAIDAGLGLALIAIDKATVRALVEPLEAPALGAICDALDVAGFAALGSAVVCLIAVPQGMRYAWWFRAAAMSTGYNFPPPPFAPGAVYILPDEQPPAARRWRFAVLGGLAIGVGAAVGLWVSPVEPGEGAARPATAARAVEPVERAVEPVEPVERGIGSARPRRTGSGDPAGQDGIAAVPRDAATAIPVGESVQHLLAAQRTALVTVDRAALAALVIPSAFGFGVDADEVGEGRDAVIAQLVRDLGPPPPGGFAVESKALAIGEHRNHAWIAEDLEVTAAGRGPRRFAVTELAAMVDGHWRIVALHWAAPINDATAERFARRDLLATPQPISDRHDGADELDRAVRAAFASRAAFAQARSDRLDAFNVGSSGERARGPAVQRIFEQLKAQIRMRDGARVALGSAWDPEQRTAPWIGWAAVNVDFSSKTRRASELTQTFRVLAVLIKEDGDWKLVQTQWSNAGLIRERTRGTKRPSE
jgi:hypothetical protein